MHSFQANKLKHKFAKWYQFHAYTGGGGLKVQPLD